MSTYFDEAKAMYMDLVSWRRTVHQNPEVGMKLPDTTAFVVAKLTEFGYDPKEICDSGIVALAGGKKPGKVFLIRGDMDALPVKEECDVDFAATNGNMHACGHDFHTAMMLGAAKMLKNHEDEINGTVKLMFQPGEEVLKGAAAMVDAGLLKNPDVDAALMIHVMTGIPVPAGAILIPSGGPFMSASDWFEIKIQGKGGHGAMPESTVDPLNIAAHIHIALQAINSREIAAVDPIVVTVGKMAGGAINNVLPDTAEMVGTIRTFSSEAREFIPGRIAEIAEGTAKMFRGSAKATITKGCPATVVDEQLVKTLGGILIENFGPQMAIKIADFMPNRTKLMGSEDFSYVTQEVPSVMISVSAGNSKDGYEYPQHHPKAKFDEACLPVGAAAYVTAAMGYLNK